MIGKGAQYLTAAGFGRYRITAASLGSLDLLGWLKGSARQAIMAAFGVDGTAVIAATNEYLNGIAASDRAKATALAGFINEQLTPWMNTYCSEYFDWIYDLMPWLGTEVWIRNASSSYFRTGVSKTSSDTIVEKTYAKYISGGGRRLTGLSPNAGAYWGVTAGNAFEMHQSETDGEAYANPGTNITVKNFCKKTYGAARDTGELQMFALGSSYSGSGIFRLDSQVYKNGTLVRWYVPFIRNGVVGYLNLLDGTMATKSGSFTIEKVTGVAAWDILSQAT